jgi:hypothetical protein
MQIPYRKTCLAAALLAFSAPSAAAIDLIFDYTYDTNNFFDTPTRKNILETAGAFFESRIHDNLGAITSGDGNSFNINFSDPADGSTENIGGFSVAENELWIFAGGRAIPGSTLGIGGPGGYSASGTGAFIDSLDRGQAGVASNNDFAPWGGSIAFNTGASWYFDQDVSTSESFSGNDFYSVALHELGHLLGFGISDSWDARVSGTDFTGPASVAAFGRNVPLEADARHWLDGTQGLLNGVLEETAMDPIIFTGTRKEFTELDLAALSDIGWEVTAVPVPAAVWLFGAALLGLVGLGRSRRA